MVVLSTEILFGIVTYQEKFWECESFISLIRSYNKSKNENKIYIYIFDNTDTDFWDIDIPIFDANIQIEYRCMKENLGISKAYNAISNFATLNNFQWLVFLDQDTKLPLHFYSTYLEKAIENNLNYPIGIPLIYSNDALMSPCRYRHYRSFNLAYKQDKYLSLKGISCINSGIMIQTLFYKKIGGYNENLKLDFCDHDFIEKVKNSLDALEILEVGLNQNFSSETDSLKKSIFRYSIFVKDLKQFSINRNFLKLALFVDLPHLLKLCYKYKSLKFLRVRWGN